MGQLNHDSKRNRGWVALALLAFAAAMLPPDRAVFAQCQYEVTAVLDIGDCDIGDSHTFGQGMNNNADVVGYYRFCAVGNERAFFWSQDTGFITLPHPPGVVRSWAYDISDTRIIVGQHEFTGIGRKGFAYDMATGEYKHLEPLHDGATATNISSANAINNAGVAAGMRIIGKSGNTPHNAVIWRPFEKGSPVEDLGVMNGPNSAALDISDNGHVAGWTGASSISIGFYRDSTGKLYLIDPEPGADTSSASAVDEDGYVIGTTVTISVPSSRANIWHKDDGMVTIEPMPGYTSSQGKDINSVGQVLMRSSIPSQVIVASLWQNGTQSKLQDLLVPGYGVMLGIPISITESGSILVQASTRAVLLTPVDVPFADLNFDCKVDVHDLVMLLNAWGPQPVKRRSAGAQSHPADLNGDGVVDGSDLLILLANWG